MGIENTGASASAVAARYTGDTCLAWDRRKRTVNRRLGPLWLYKNLAKDTERRCVTLGCGEAAATSRDCGCRGPRVEGAES